VAGGGGVPVLGRVRVRWLLMMMMLIANKYADISENTVLTCW
jgi:hypothetical protein